MKKPLHLILFILISSTFCSKAQVVINEYSASNLSSFADNFGKHEDWIELYNAGASAVNLGGYFLSDDSTQATKWQIPANLTISAGGFLRFWASGRNLVQGTGYHTSFKLTQTRNNKEDLVLADPSGTIIDGTRLSVTQLAHSMGRTTNGSSTWGIFTTPTPNSSNNAQVSYIDYADKPDFSLGAGFYSGGQVVGITSTDTNAVIRYTLDGTLPTVSSAIYSSPINISATSVLKAVTFSNTPGVLPSFVRFETYFINVSHTMPVISVAATQLTTLANGTGSLTPSGTFEYFDTAGIVTARTYGEFDRHGQDSWQNSHRSIDFTSRDEMGYNHSVEEKLFDLSPRDNFQRLIFRAAGDDNYPADHSPQNAGSAHVRDAYIQTLAKRGGMNLDVRISEKVIIYMNGQYWGVYDIRERPDDHDYTNYYYGQDKYHIEYIKTWGGTWIEYGPANTLTNWGNFYNYIMTNSMLDPAKYQYVIDRYDATSLADYVIINSFTVCSDWLNYNTGWWRGLDTTGTHLRWGYTLWDNDATFDFYINYTGIPNTSANALPCDAQGLTGGSDPEGHIQILNRLMMNPTFNQWYISRMVDLWNTVFSCDNMLSQLDSVQAVLDPEMDGQATRWGGTYVEWTNNMQTLRNFIAARCNLLANGFNTCYNLNGPYDIVLNADSMGAGELKFNSLTFNESQLPWHGKYFGGMENVMQAIPEVNHYFTTWSSVTQTINPSLTSPNASVILNAGDSIVAHFSSTVSAFESDVTNPVVNAYPTLVNTSTTLDFSLPENAPVTISLHSLIGDKVSVITNEKVMQKGFYSVNIDLSSARLEAGVYLIHFTAGNSSKTIKLIYAP